MKSARHRISILLLAASLLSGCSESSSVPLDKYLTRLANSLDRPITVKADRLPPLPRSRDLQIDPQSHSIGLLDLLALNGCELSITIGNINSSLGKLASDSQRLLLELEFLSLAPDCAKVGNKHLVICPAANGRTRLTCWLPPQAEGDGY